MNFVFYLIIFLFGTMIGSFLNSVIYRTENRQSFIKGRSYCPACGHKLGFFDLIPVLSFFFLKGRCRYCGQRISWQYPIVEISTGLIFSLIFNFKFLISNGFLIFNFQTIISTIYLWIISALLIIIFVYDLKHYVIPDKAIYLATGVVLLYRLLENPAIGRLTLGAGISGGLMNPLAAAISVGFFFLLIWFFSKGKWMGFGDVKLAFLGGFFLGYPLVLIALFSAFLIGAIIGLGLVAAKRKRMTSQVPFGPFLATGVFIALFWGQTLIDWYLGLII